MRIFNGILSNILVCTLIVIITFYTMLAIINNYFIFCVYFRSTLPYCMNYFDMVIVIIRKALYNKDMTVAN